MGRRERDDEVHPFLWYRPSLSHTHSEGVCSFFSFFLSFFLFPSSSLSLLQGCKLSFPSPAYTITLPPLPPTFSSPRHPDSTSHYFLPSLAPARLTSNKLATMQMLTKVLTYTLTHMRTPNPPTLPHTHTLCLYSLATTNGHHS